MGDGWILLEKLRASFFNEDLPNEPNLARSISLDGTFNIEQKSKRRALSFVVAVNGPNPHPPVCFCSSNGHLPSLCLSSLCVAAGGFAFISSQGAGVELFLMTEKRHGLRYFLSSKLCFQHVPCSVHVLKWSFYAMYGILKNQLACSIIRFSQS